MPLVSFAPENKQQSAYKYPRLSLEMGARKRVALVEDMPTFEFTHTLEVAQIVDGAPVYEQKTKFGKLVDELQKDFIGRHVCIGDYARLEKNGVDPDNCPSCAASQESDAVKPPERRFAMHVIDYALQPGSMTVATPFTISLCAWVFSEGRFNTLTDLRDEWGDLRQRDLLLGPCTSKQFQNYDIAVAQKAEWLATKETQKLAKEIYDSQKCPDLSVLIGRKVGRELIEEDLDRVLTAYRQATGRNVGVTIDTPSAVEVAADKGDSWNAPIVDVSDIFNSTPTESDEAPATLSMDLDDIIDGSL